MPVALTISEIQQRAEPFNGNCPLSRIVWAKDPAGAIARGKELNIDELRKTFYDTRNALRKHPTVANLNALAAAHAACVVAERVPFKNELEMAFRI